jgi:hypothetical protein
MLRRNNADDLPVQTGSTPRSSKDFIVSVQESQVIPKWRCFLGSISRDFFPVDAKYGNEYFS